MAIVRFENKEKVFDQIAQQVISEMQGFIEARNSVVYGDLINSFKYDISPSVLRIYSQAKYAGAVDKGRGITQKGSGGSLRMNLADWLLTKGISLRRYSKGKNQWKFVSRTASNINMVAGAMANKIHGGGYGQKYGVVDFSGQTMNKLKDQITEEVGEAYYRDIKRMIDENLSRMVKSKKTYE